MIDPSFYFKQKYRIPSTRLRNWNYSSTGYYFVTICAFKKNCYFGEIKNNQIILSKIGKIAERYWLEIPKHFLFVKLDEYIIMPNHIHGIIIIKNKKYTVETQNFASLQNKNINGNKFGWQPRFYDHIIRSERSLNEIRQYIINNPLKWEEDEENPKNIVKYKLNGKTSC